METLILVGGGGHCESCIDVIESTGRYLIEGIVDIKDKIGQNVLGYKIIASDEELGELSKNYNSFLITVGQIKSAGLRKRLFCRLKDLGVKLPVIISPTAYVSKHTSIAEGTIVMHKAFINAGAKVGINCIINTGAIVEHGAEIGDHCHISTGAILNGGVKLGENSFFGSCSVSREYITIGADVIVSAGVRVMRNVADNSRILRDAL